MKRCKDTVGHKNYFADSGISYEVCGRKAKYDISYRGFNDGKIIKRSVCGIHCNSVKGYAERMKRIGYDIQLKINEIKVKEEQP